MEIDFIRGKVDSTLLCKNFRNDLMICQIYVDDIIFGSANPSVCQEFSELMQVEFEMSLMQELKSFMGIQIS